MLFFLFLWLLCKCDFLAAQVTLSVFRNTGLFRSLSPADSAFWHLRSPPFIDPLGAFMLVLPARRIQFCSPGYIMGIFWLKNWGDVKKRLAGSKMRILQPFRFERQSKHSSLLDDFSGFFETFDGTGDANPVGTG